MDAPLKILILEDLADDAKLIERALQAAGIAHATRNVATRAAYVQALDEWRPDVVLADFRLPDFDGREALELARARRPELPVIIVTGTLDDQGALELLRAGASDYMLKDRLSRLGAAVLRAVETARGEALQRETQERHRLLFEESRDGIALIDCDSGHIVEANAEFQRQAGRGLDELRAVPSAQLSIPAMVEAERLSFALTDPGRGTEHDFEMERPDGTSLPVEIRAKRVELRGEGYVLLTSRDMSERKAGERKLHAQLDELRRFQRVTVDRELRLQELEQEIQRLKDRVPA